MNLSARHFSGAFVLAPMGRVDNASSDPFLQALSEVVATCQKESRLLVLDFSAVEYISSIGLRALMIAARQMKTGGGTMVIAGLQPLVREVFSIARFDLILHCFDSVEAAVLGTPPKP